MYLSALVRPRRNPIFVSSYICMYKEIKTMEVYMYETGNSEAISKQEY